MTTPSPRCKLIALMLAGLLANTAGAQPFTLDMAIARSEAGYPILRQKGLIRQSEQLAQENLSRQLLPQLSLSGQATMQSDVTRLQIPNAPFQVEPLSKDQYRAWADLSQIVYDGGQIRAQRALSSVRSALDDARVTVELHQLKERVQQLYFGILRSESQAKLISIAEEDIEAGIRRTEAQVAGGTAYRSALSLLKAERLKAGQRRLDLEAAAHGYREALSVLTDTTLTDAIRLESPRKAEASATEGRPEIGFFETQRSLADEEKRVVTAKTMPRASVFMQGGYGRPGLNMLQNEFAWFGMGGLRLSWQLNALYSAKRDRTLADIKAGSVALQEDAFRRSNLAQIRQQEAELERLDTTIKVDDEIVDLRHSIKLAALAQLEAGVITAADYLREVHAEDSARQEREGRMLRRAEAIHRLAWLQGGH